MSGSASCSGSGACRRLLLEPADAPACADHLRGLGDAAAVFRWFRRLAVLPEARIDGDVLRRAIIASGTADRGALRALANSVPRSNRPIGSFVAASLLVNRRVDATTVAATPVRYVAGGDGLARALAVLSEKVIPASVQDAFDIMIAKQHVWGTLAKAGYFEAADAASIDASTFARRMRRNLHGTAFRGFTEHWTFAIGHLVLLACLMRGQEAGLLDFRGARIWAGPVANRFLFEQALGLSSDVEIVPRWSSFADNHSSSLLEWVDGRFVDCFEACGIVADRAGDSQGAILPRRSPADPALAGFYAAAGLSPGDRVVTLHCREAGYRVDDRHDLRNVDIADYLPGLAALVARGYRVVRLGDPTMKPLPRLDGVFDYAVSALKSPELDILLPAIARFHIGSSSGLSLVPLLYGTPCLFLNWHPIDMLPWGRRNWTVMKPIERLADRRRILDRAGYATLGRMRDPTLLNAAGHRASDLAPAEVERAILDFAATFELDEPPPQSGRNLGRVLVAGDDGGLRDLA